MGISKALFLLLFSLFVAYSHAYTFYVGGREGWVLHPSESYSDWASRNRFQVNDTLVFKYNKGEDSVLEVSQQDYDQCNLNNPIQRMDTGDSVFKFDRSGPFFFVSGTGDRCKQGEKLVVVVLAVRPKGPNEPVPPSISPLPPSVPNPPMAPTLSPGPNTPVVGPPVISPVLTPTVSPVTPPTGSLAPSPHSVSPPTNSPVSPPTVSPAPSPFTVTPSVPSPSLAPPTGTPSSPSTQPSESGAPVTSAPNVETPNQPTGSAPIFRLSSASFAVMVVILNYGFFN